MATCFLNATLVQLDPPAVESGNLRVEDGVIETVGVGAKPHAGDEVVECDGAVLMPGLVNGHTHLYSALAAGMPPPPRTPSNFHEILKLIWWRLDRAHTLASVAVSGQIGALAALRCGTTTLVDHHASPTAIEGSLAALESGIAEVGCRGLLCYEVTDRNGQDESRLGLEENERYANSCKRDGRFAPLIGAHASFTMEDESLTGCVELAKRLQIGVHIHVAEDPVDEQFTRERFGVGLFERFERHGLLEVAGTIFAHGTHLSESDFARLNELDDTIELAHNPNSNMNNGVGYTPVARLQRSPLLGTDGIGADMWREARTAQFKSHDEGLPLRFGQPLEMLGQSARFASHCLGVQLGMLEVGAAADLVLTSYRPATPLSDENLAGHFLYAMGPEFVSSVMIAGRWCLKNGEVVSCDEPALRAGSVAVARELHERMSDISE
jgi:putative selenium metabolism protein SsnA